TAPGGTRIDVRFVDPDAEDETPPHEELDVPELDLRSLALAARADEPTVRFLLDELARTRRAIESDDFVSRKEGGLEAVHEQAFWDRDDRFAVLTEVEYLDRLEAALETAIRLGERLSRHAGDELAELLAIRLYVLRSALDGLARGAPAEVYLRVRGDGGLP